MHCNDHAQMIFFSIPGKNSCSMTTGHSFSDQSNKNTWYVTAQLSKAKFYALQFLDTMTSVGYEVEEH